MSLPVPQPILYTEVPMYIYFVFLLLFWRSSAFPPSPTTLIECDIAVPDQSRRNPTLSFYLINSANLWNEGLVPYSFEKIDFMGNGEEEDMFGEKEKKLIQDSLSSISSHVPCLRFKEVPSTSTVHRLIFSSMEEGCFSYVGNVGPQGGKTGQTVNLGFGCYNHKLVIHEVLHALGASHEQNRNDRDSHVKIHFENIKEGGSKNFEKKSSIFNSRGTPYDYTSIMQYGVTDFGIDGKVTISSDRHEISDPASLSAIDIAELAEVYQGVTKENCYTQEMFLGYVGALEKRIADLEGELKQTTAEVVETTTLECISKVPGGRCKIDGNGYILSSTGKAAEYSGGRLGLYEEVEEPDYVHSKVYRQQGGASFIYKEDDKWLCGETVGASRGAFYTTELFSQPGEWHYYDGEALASDDMSIQFLPLTPTSCILQPSILITSTGPANSIRADYLGYFTIVQDVFSAGRPVWRNSKGKTLKINPGKTYFGVYDGIESTSPYVLSGSGPTCPTDTKASHSDRLGRNAWQYWHGGKHVDDATILVQ